MDELAAAVEAALSGRDARERGGELLFQCPCHDDTRPSARYHPGKRAWCCDACDASGGLLVGDHPLAALLGIDPKDFNGRRSTPKLASAQRWEVRDATGKLVAVHHRRDLPSGKKDIWWTGPKGEKKLDCKIAELPLYGSERLADREPGDDTPVIVCEGEKATDAILAAGLPALGTVTGANSAPGGAALEVVRGRRVVLWPDNDDPGRRHMQKISAALANVASSVRIFAPEGAPVGGDAVEWIAAQNGDARKALLMAIDEQGREPGTAAGPRFDAIDEGRYRLEDESAGVRLEADFIRREGAQVKGELAAYCDHPDAKTFDGLLSCSDFNFSSARTRVTQAKYFAERSGSKDLDWLAYVEEFCQRLLQAERSGQPAVWLNELPEPEEDQEIRVVGLPLLRHLPQIHFGDGGTGKSIHGLWTIGKLAEQGIKVALFDWELDERAHRLRFGRLFPGGMPPVRYARCSKPFAYEVERLRRIVRDDRIEFAMFDSIGFATDGPAEAQESAARYYQALRQLGAIGSLHIAHETKSSENAGLKPFGSVFWANGARACWNVKLAEADPNADLITVGFFDRKRNLRAKSPSVGFEIQFARDRTNVRRVDLATVDDLSADLTTPERIEALLRERTRTREELASILDDVKPATLRSALNRGKNRGSLVEVDGRFGLPERRLK